MVVERQSRPLVTFSTLSMVYQERDRQLQQQTQQQTRQQEELFEKRKITIKPRVVQVAPVPAPVPDPVPAPVPVSEKQYLQSEKNPNSNPKIIIIKKNQQQKQREKDKQEEKDKQRKKITFVKRRFKYSDIAPPATMCFTPKNDIYPTPPPNCCRFFIEGKHCFLRQRDSACICPTSKTVIGFWNEKVGIVCNLLPVEDETTYEEATAIEIVDKTIPEEAQQPTSSASDSSIPSPKQKTKLAMSLIPKPKFVSDAQRARIASEPVALLREKLAKQYNMTMTKKN